MRQIRGKLPINIKLLNLAVNKNVDIQGTQSLKLTFFLYEL